MKNKYFDRVFNGGIYMTLIEGDRVSDGHVMFELSRLSPEAIVVINSKSENAIKRCLKLQDNANICLTPTPMTFMDPSTRRDVCTLEHYRTKFKYKGSTGMHCVYIASVGGRNVFFPEKYVDIMMLDSLFGNPDRRLGPYWNDDGTIVVMPMELEAEYRVCL